MGDLGEVDLEGLDVVGVGLERHSEVLDLVDGSTYLVADLQLEAWTPPVQEDLGLIIIGLDPRRN